jgi:hypothetical protein
MPLSVHMRRCVQSENLQAILAECIERYRNGFWNLAGRFGRFGMIWGTSDRGQKRRLVNWRVEDDRESHVACSFSTRLTTELGTAAITFIRDHVEIIVNLRVGS